MVITVFAASRSNGLHQEQGVHTEHPTSRISLLIWQVIPGARSFFFPFSAIQEAVATTEIAGGFGADDFSRYKISYIEKLTFSILRSCI